MKVRLLLLKCILLISIKNFAQQPTSSEVINDPIIGKVDPYSIFKLPQIHTSKMEDVKLYDPENTVQEFKKGGLLLYNSFDGQIYKYNGTNWENIDSGGMNSLTKIEADSNIEITGSGTDTDPYKIKAIPATLKKRDSDGAYVFSNGVDDDVVFKAEEVSSYSVTSINVAGADCGVETNTKGVAIEIIGTGFKSTDTPQIVINEQEVITSSIVVDSTTKIKAKVNVGSQSGKFDVRVTINSVTKIVPQKFVVTTSGLNTFQLSIDDLWVNTPMTSYDGSILKSTHSTYNFKTQAYSKNDKFISFDKGGSLQFKLSSNMKDYSRIQIGLSANPSSIDDAVKGGNNLIFQLYRHGKSNEQLEGIIVNGSIVIGNKEEFSINDVFEIKLDCKGNISFIKGGVMMYTQNIGVTTEKLYFYMSLKTHPGFDFGIEESNDISDVIMSLPQ